MARRVALSAFAFLLGFSTVFVPMGASASAINRLVVDHIDILAKIGGAVIVLFGLHVMGLLRIPLLHREVRFNRAATPSATTCPCSPSTRSDSGQRRTARLLFARASSRNRALICANSPGGMRP